MTTTDTDQWQHIYRIVTEAVSAVSSEGLPPWVGTWPDADIVRWDDDRMSVVIQCLIALGGQPDGCAFDDRAFGSAQAATVILRALDMWEASA